MSTSRSGLLVAAVAGFVGSVFVGVSGGDLLDFQAFSSATVRQVQDAQQVNSDSGQAAFPGSAIPIHAQASLAGFDSSEQKVFGGVANVMVNEPQFNSAIPADFLIETLAGGNDGVSVMQASTVGRQVRQLRLLSEEVNDLPAGQEVTLRSTFFIDGVLAAVVSPDAGAVQGLRAGVTVNISQNGDASVFSGRVELVGQADGSVGVEVDGDFAVTDFQLADVDAGPDVGKVTLAVFDALELPYTYDAIVGESFELTAEISTEVEAISGTAGGAVFGTVPGGLIELAGELFRSPVAAKAAAGQFASAAPAAVPEPASVLLLLGGISAFGLRNGRTLRVGAGV